MNSVPDHVNSGSAAIRCIQARAATPTTAPPAAKAATTVIERSAESRVTCRRGNRCKLNQR